MIFGLSLKMLNAIEYSFSFFFFLINHTNNELKKLVHIFTYRNVVYAVPYEVLIMTLVFIYRHAIIKIRRKFELEIQGLRGRNNLLFYNFEENNFT